MGSGRQRKLFSSKRFRLFALLLCVYGFVTIVWWQSSGSAADNYLHGHQFVVFSSDDWGRWTDAVPVWPDRATFTQWLEDGNQMHHPVWGKCGAETQQDLIDFHEALQRINGGGNNLWDTQSNVPFRQRVAITPYFIVGGPDYLAMKKAGCEPGISEAETCNYIERPFDVPRIDNPEETKKLKSIQHMYKKLYQEGWWHPEYHGRIHFDKFLWENLLKKGNVNAKKCFEKNLACADDYTYLRTENTMFNDWKDLLEWQKVGIQYFERFWGYKPTIYNCPHNISHPQQFNVLDNLQHIVATETYVEKTSKKISYLDRVRFDGMVTWWNTTRQLELVTSTLEDKRQPFAILMWHAQNWIRAVYTTEESDQLRGIFLHSVDYLRRKHPEVVFVTSSELHQIRGRGHSIMRWPKNLVLRNYMQENLRYKLDRETMSKLSGFSEEEPAVVLDLTSGLIVLEAQGKIGSYVTVPPDREYYVGYDRKHASLSV
ncbi:hypothetical protein PROFUN_14038 [Planoprotostelium fungivorum]|uniref:Uncharacterized protein n=1 Tax=Planoprotostelium fungivorum TaxID=1890364 RepID=A0A2P6N284_9EUKA|nr:hypothetical protein PROFUN_14038 [Planoprotostelium fungivorum]